MLAIVPIKFEVLGEPVAQGRQRHARRGNHIMTYDPEKSRLYKSLVRDAAAKVMPEVPLDIALHLYVIVYRSIPGSWSDKKQKAAQDGEIRPSKRPDLDNYIKAIMDALTGVIWRDDSQVTSMYAAKCYDVRPRIEVVISECAGMECVSP